MYRWYVSSQWKWMDAYMNRNHLLFPVMLSLKYGLVSTCFCLPGLGNTCLCLSCEAWPWQYLSLSCMWSLALAVLVSVSLVKSGLVSTCLSLMWSLSCQAFEGWGDVMRRYYRRHTSYRDSDLTLKYLGWWTDNGRETMLVTTEKAPPPQKKSPHIKN